jgi:hypothetical protein
MYTTLLLSALTAITLAAPLAHNTTDSWEVATGSKTTCNVTSDKIIGFYVGPQLETVLNNACAEMMSPCAYQERLPNDTICTQAMNWPLYGPKKSIQSANVETGDGNKISGWDVQCKSLSPSLVIDLVYWSYAIVTVTPVAQPEDSAGVSWTKQDCYGYFAYMLENEKPKGCHNNKGFGVGNIKVGGDSSLKDTVFEVTIVPEK